MKALTPSIIHAKHDDHGARSSRQKQIEENIKKSFAIDDPDNNQVFVGIQGRPEHVQIERNLVSTSIVCQGYQCLYNSRKHILPAKLYNALRWFNMTATHGDPWEPMKIRCLLAIQVMLRTSPGLCPLTTQTSFMTMTWCKSKANKKRSRKLI